jgi:hypothetical protein
VNQPRRLLLNGGDDAGMILAESIDADAGDEVKVPFAVGVPHPGTVAAHQDQRMTSVILEQILAFQFDNGH